MRLIWTASAVEKHERGTSDPRHTISNLVDERNAEGFIRQMRAGVPWLLMDDDGTPVAAGEGPSYIYSAGYGLRKVVAA